LNKEFKREVVKTYKIKEIYYTLQGEGQYSGRPAVFCRFSGCNLWSGIEADRHKAICQFCDTDFWGLDGENGGKYTAEELSTKLSSLWPEGNIDDKFVVFTGGEPLLQMDASMNEIVHSHGFEIAIETNGTIEVPEGVDWVCMSPKANTDIIVRKGDELKVIYPQFGIDPQDFEKIDFTHLYLQPMDNAYLEENTVACIEYCKVNPKWRLSIQTHKLLNIP